MDRVGKKEKYFVRYDEGGKNGGEEKDLLAILKYLDASGLKNRDSERFYESGVVPTPIPSEWWAASGGQKDMSAKDVRTMLELALDNYDKNYRGSSGELKPQDQIMYDYYSDLLKLSDEDLPRSYRKEGFGFPAQFYDTSKMDEIKPIGVKSISTDVSDTDVSDKELQMSEEQKMELDPNYLPPGAFREPNYSYNSRGIPTQDGWRIIQKGPVDKYGNQKVRMYTVYFKKKDGSHLRQRSIYYQGEEYQAGGKIKVLKK